MIKVAICDDEKNLCDIYARLISRTDDMECVGIAHNASDAVRVVSEKQPDVILLDILMEESSSGIDVIPKLKALCPKLKVVLLSSYTYEEYIFDGLANGADDYLVKTMSISEIIDAIRKAYNDLTVIDSKILKVFRKKVTELRDNRTSLLYAFNNLVKLTKNEFEVLREVYSGKTYKQIADERFVTESTIQTQCSRILAKCEAKNMKTLIANLHELKLFDR